ncbi:MAG: NAD(P)-dependent glycerol-3-phosphate dehydrogenase [Tissierellia bacterium]|nr:NAD(P)-dependent glycerol-3-phosphate dehydrogenase [Tissierellia bacterium]
MKITIVGAGSWGTAMARHCAHLGHDVTLYARRREVLEEIRDTHINSQYLPDIILPRSIRFSDITEDALNDAEMVIMAIGAQNVRSFLDTHASKLKGKMVVSLSKGIEVGTHKLMHEVYEEFLPGLRYTALSGPSHAEEVATDLPTTVVAASSCPETSKIVQECLNDNTLRIYTSDDLSGVELGGALKNVIALAVGISDGYGYADNTKAALMTRGMAEILRLGLALGAKLSTFLGLSGMGDLIVTCTSKHSRNRRCGELIGRGIAPEEAIKRIGMVVESVPTLESTLALSEKLGIEMPICQVLRDILDGSGSVEDTVEKLMRREMKEEIQV